MNNTITANSNIEKMSPNIDVKMLVLSSLMPKCAGSDPPNLLLLTIKRKRSSARWKERKRTKRKWEQRKMVGLVGEGDSLSHYNFWRRRNFVVFSKNPKQLYLVFKFCALFAICHFLFFKFKKWKCSPNKFSTISNVLKLKNKDWIYIRTPP